MRCAGLVDAESFGEDRCGEPAGERQLCAVATGATGDAVGRQALAQVLGGDVGAALAAREQPAVVFAVGDALVSKGERDRGERLRQDDRTARERESDLAAVSSRDVAGAQLRDPGQRLGVEQQHAAANRSRRHEQPLATALWFR